jgi:nitrogen fixation/metabolism regulation signal transduction histidine kinase
MMRVLRQFIKNAAGAIDQAGGTLALSIESCASENEVALSISDDGAPLPEAIRDVLLDANLSGKAFDQGLGFLLARKIVEGHKGRIELSQPEGAGNTVRLFLPTLQLQTEA